MMHSHNHLPIEDSFLYNYPTMNVLHIEDQIEDAILVKDILNSENSPSKMCITHVDTLPKGLNISHDQEFDAILLDLNLGEDQGVDNIIHVKKKYPSVPIVVLTGHNNKNVMLSSLASGAQEYLDKNSADATNLHNVLSSSIVRKKAQLKEYKELEYDSVTHLPFASAFNKKLRDVLRDKDTTSAMIIVNIDNIDNILHGYGYEISDLMIKETSKRILSTMNIPYYMARYNDNQIAILLSGENHKLLKQVHSLCLEINVNIHKPFYIKKIDDFIDLSMSIGAVLNPKNIYSEGKMIPFVQSAIAEAQLLGEGRKVKVTS